MANKGKPFERETAGLAGKYGERIPMSGSIKGIPQLSGDVRWKFPWFDDEIHLECKHGYGRGRADKFCPTCGRELDDKARARIPKGQKSMTIYREWFDKHLEQAKQYGFYPVFSMKFKFTSENGLSSFIMIPFPVAKELMRQMENLWLELQELRDEQTKQDESQS